MKMVISCDGKTLLDYHEIERFFIPRIGDHISLKEYGTLRVSAVIWNYDENCIKVHVV